MAHAAGGGDTRALSPERDDAAFCESMAHAASGSATRALRAEQDEAFRESMAHDARLAGPPRMPPVEPSENHGDAIVVRLKLLTGEICERRFLMEEPPGLSLLEFVRFRHQSRSEFRFGVRDGSRLRWLDPSLSLQAQGILPMDLLICQERDA